MGYNYKGQKIYLVGQHREVLKVIMIFLYNVHQCQTIEKFKLCVNNLIERTKHSNTRT